MTELDITPDTSPSWLAELKGRVLSKKSREYIDNAIKALSELIGYVDSKDPPDEELDFAQGVLFADLSLTSGKDFDGMAFGAFVDMNGREVTLSANDKQAFVINTQAAIEATRSESGELVGLPIDAGNHDKGDAAGWIVGIELAGDIVRLIPKWTRIGVDLIGNGIRRFFSPTVNVRDKVILGGALVNWPATTDKTGKILLRPIELSAGAKQVTELNELTAEQRDALLAQARQRVLAELAPGANTDTPDEAIGRLREQLNLSAFAEVADLSTARDAMLTQMKAALEAEYKRMQSNAGSMLAEMMAGIKREQHIAEFSQQVTGGTDKVPYGLPIGREEVEAFLGSLNDQQRAGAESILGRVWENGRTAYSELGHGRKLKGTTQLPTEIERHLSQWVKDGNNITEFFQINATELGDMAQYNLSRYEEK